MFRKLSISTVTLCLTAVACGAAHDDLGSIDTTGSVEGEGAGAESVSDTGLYDSVGRGLGTVSASIVTANQDSELEQHLVARLEVQENELLEFYEPEPGLLLLSVAGAPKAGSVLSELPQQWTSSTLDAYWGALAGGAPVPETLRAAVGRAGQYVPEAFEAVATVGQIGPEAAPERLVATGPSLELRKYQAGGGWCETDFYTVDVKGDDSTLPLGACRGGYSTQVCWDHVTGLSAAWHSNSRKMRTSACPVQGTIKLNVTRSGNFSSWTVTQNSFRTAWFTGGPLCEINDSCGYTESRVTEADGDNYHFYYEVVSG